jgi:hypothetical protein
MKTTGLNLFEALKLCKKFQCTIYNEKTKKYVHYNYLVEATFNYHEVTFDDWRLTDLFFVNFDDALIELLRKDPNPRQVYLVSIDEKELTEIYADEEGIVRYKKDNEIVVFTREVKKSEYLID